MDFLNDVPISEADKVRESVHRIRLKEKDLRKKYPLGDHTTYWNADELRHVLYRKAIRFRMPFGEECFFTGDVRFRDKDILVFDVDALVPFQFVDEFGLKSLFIAYRVFRGGDSQVDIGSFLIEGLDNIRAFCSRMDDCIREEAISLKNSGIEKDIFEKLWNEMGGETILKTDTVGNRLRFFKDLVGKFKSNRPLWRSEMIRTKLIKK